MVVNPAEENKMGNRQIKTCVFVGCLLVAVNAGTYGGQKIGLEDIEKEYNPTDRALSYMQPKASSSAVPSPTKFGFVPKRTAASYAAAKPKLQFTQANYKVKQPSYQTQYPQYQQQYTTQYTQPQASYQQKNVDESIQQYAIPSSASEYAQQYSSGSQQYASPQQAQQYSYVQPEVQQQYTLQYQQPGQQYEQYENVQYVNDNSIVQPESQSQQYYPQEPQPQYYYVQQFQSPSTAVESVVDPKALSQIAYAPSYAPNSISIDEKQLAAYLNGAEAQLPPITTTVAKYTTATSKKHSGTKQYLSQNNIQYVLPSAQTQQQQYYKQDEILIKRQPKSLLDSYVPSILQLQYLRQKGKNGYSKY